MDVSQKFKSLLNVLFYAHLFEIGNIVASVIMIWTKTHEKLFLIRHILSITYVLLFCGFIIMHVFRLRHEGRVCSGDFLEEDTDLTSPEIESLYLIRRGRFFRAMLIFYWSLISVAFCACCSTLSYFAFALFQPDRAESIKEWVLDFPSKFMKVLFCSFLDDMRE